MSCGRFGFEEVRPGTTPDARSYDEDALLATDGAENSHDAVWGQADESCAALAAEATALWVFDGIDEKVMPELNAGRNGQVFGSPTLVAGPPGACGSAMSFPGAAGSYVLVPHDPAWDLSQGSLDFWVRPGRANGIRGLVTRDHVGAKASGHFGVFLLSQNRLAVRIQEASSAPAGGSVVGLCSDTPLEADAWVHIGINFGAPEAELYINGVRSRYEGTSPDDSTLGNFACGLNSTQGIAGNQEPWIFGASNHQADTSGEVDAFARSASFGRIRLSAQRQPFSLREVRDN